jgi:hypothetical protein
MAQSFVGGMWIFGTSISSTQTTKLFAFGKYLKIPYCMLVDWTRIRQNCQV